MTDRKSQAGRVLGREERLENALAVGLGDARPAILELDHHLAPFAARHHADLPSRGLRLAAVHDQVHRDLAEHDRAATHHQRVGPELVRDLDVRELAPRADEVAGLAQDEVHVDR
jgi:hypothetical protein